MQASNIIPSDDKPSAIHLDTIEPGIRTHPDYPALPLVHKPDMVAVELQTGRSLHTESGFTNNIPGLIQIEHQQPEIPRTNPDPGLILLAKQLDKPAVFHLKIKIRI